MGLEETIVRKPIDPPAWDEETGRSHCQFSGKDAEGGDCEVTVNEPATHNFKDYSAADTNKDEESVVKEVCSTTGQATADPELRERRSRPRRFQAPTASRSFESTKSCSSDENDGCRSYISSASTIQSAETYDLPPEPPTLEMGEYFIQPGAFRMTSSFGDEISPSPPIEQFPLPSLSANSSMNASGEFLVEASLVNEASPGRPPESAPSSSLALVEAKAMEPESGFCKIRKLTCILLFVLVLVLASTIGIGVWLAGGAGRDETSSTTSGATIYSGGPSFAVSPTAVPTVSPAPTSSPTVFRPMIEIFQNTYLPSYTLAALADPISPQSRALTWLESDTLSLSTNITWERRVTRFALATLFYATNGDSWMEKGGWLTEADECQWYYHGEIGESCFDGIFSAVGLVGNGLNGTLPEEIALLTDLQMISIRSNQDLTGEVPSTISALTNLEFLALWGNKIQGTFPMDLAKLPLLDYLDLEDNKFRGRLPDALGNLTKMRDLYISSNQLSGAFPSDLSGLTALNSLWCRENRFSGTLPSYFASFSHLTWLDINSNNFTGQIEGEFWQSWSTKMNNLDIGKNRLTGSIHSKIGLLSRLTYLDMFENDFTGTLPTEIGQLTDLEYLYFDGNRLRGTIPAEIGRLSSLVKLYTHGNNFEGSIPSDVCDLVRTNGLKVVVDCGQVQCDCGCHCEIPKR